MTSGPRLSVTHTQRERERERGAGTLPRPMGWNLAGLVMWAMREEGIAGRGKRKAELGSLGQGKGRVGPLWSKGKGGGFFLNLLFKFTFKYEPTQV